MDGNCVLKIKDGKFVTFKKFGRIMKMCAEDLQTENQNDFTVEIHRRETNEKNQVAFYYRHQNQVYSPKVAVNSSQLEVVLCNAGFSEDNWFEKVNLGSGEYYGLQSVAKPMNYLSVNGRNFIVSNDNQKCVYITDEKIQTRTSS